MPLDGLVENLEAPLSGLPGWILENLSAVLLSVLPDRIPENFMNVYTMIVTFYFVKQLNKEGDINESE